MEEEKDAFYVVKKGDVIGIYKSLRDLIAEAGISQAYDPSLRVYKGYGLSKQAEVYLGSCGLKNAAYSISASEVNDNTFGKLVPCPPQQPTSFRGNTSNRDPSPNRLHQILGKDLVGSTSLYTDPRINHMNFTNQVMPSTQMMPSNSPYYIIEFDGASKGNPGPAGAGAVLRTEDGRVVCRLREGVGIATNNVAEYRAAILGMKYALRKGFKHVRVQGDSNLVCMQVQGRWKIKSQNLVELNKVAKDLKDKFISFQINHVDREFNSEADALANQAVNLMNGQVQEDWLLK
ncbi:putative ribonuclease H protein At1g65750 isoform X1 [Gossypium raimondii]|uniref:RNase H type-1 domain-containing protein n=1 Tax=Gossypium raimondii TaxID=29730 RepID=A0A0D2P4V6_GOSRA|nr:putative ribonuclease H protein At1g65750 isoform X1 [Gossypium raimondii]KJB40792.1 hypothetical protein B456_007G077300 [Gossypium raimondii]